MIFEHKIGVKGRFKARVYGPDGKLRKESGWSSNVVTDLGVRMLLGGSTVGFSTTSVSIRCSCGSGNSAASVGDTQIQSFVAGTGSVISNSTVRNSTVSPYYVMHTWTWRFTEGQAQGNISELCVVNNSSTPTASSPAFSRALVRDAAGNPTTITVLADEFLDVTYELFLYPPSSDSSGSFNQMIDGSPAAFSYVIRASNIQTAGTPGNSSGWASSGSSGVPTVFANTGGQTSSYTFGGSLGGVGSAPTGARNEFTGGTTSATANYELKYRDLTFTAGLSNSNVTFDCLRFACNLCCYQMQLSPAITKINTKTYTITIRITLDNTI